MTDVVILCGGKGTRAYPDTLELPKPLLSVAGIPVVEHVMRIYAAQGHRRFILAVGYLGELIAERYSEAPEDWEIEVVDTGDESETGERIRLAAQHVQGDRFFATYADGVGNVDVNELLKEHLEHGALATVTTVPLPSQYGVLDSDPDDRIVHFREKPRLQDHWINGGFFVFEKRALDHWQGQVLEQDVLPALAQIGGLYAYRHQGFWKSMDTYKDRQELNALAESGPAPWETTAGAALGLAIADEAWARAEKSEGAGSALMLAGGRSSEATLAPTLERREQPDAAAAVGAPTTGGRRDIAGGEGARATRNGNGNGNGNGHHAPDHGNGNGNGAATVSAAPEPAIGGDARPFMPPARRSATRRARLLSGASALLDLGAVALAYLFVGSIKSGPVAGRLVGSDQPELLLTAPLWIGAFAAYGLYDRRRLVASSEEARRLLQGVMLGAVLVILATFAADMSVARAWVAVLSIVTAVSVGAGRVLLRGVAQWLSARGAVGHRVLVVGTNDEAYAIARTLDRKRWLGYGPVGLVATSPSDVARNGFPVVGTLDRIEDAVKDTEAGAVIIASTAIKAEHLGGLCNSLHNLGVDVRVSPGLPHVSASRVSVEPLDGLAVLSVRAGHELSRPQRALKRTLDLVGGTILCLLTAPIVAGLVLLVRATSRGPALFKQVRVGEGGRPFVLYKLRTMRAGAADQVIDLRDRNEADGLLFKLEHDPRVTRVGRVLRRWGLDELPQLWNVVKGQMSLVGPRPPLPEESARYDAWVRGRLKVKPGITGLWQVNGGHILSWDDYVRYDLFYVENWSLGVDLYVLARTVPALLFRRGLS